VQKDRTEPWAAPAVSASASGRTADVQAQRVRYRLEQGTVNVELPAKSAKPRGRASVLHAELDLDPSLPEKTTGKVEVDLASLSMFGDSGEIADPERSRRALEWLGLGASVAADSRETGRKASFQVRSLARTPQGTWRVRGELALSGVRAPESVEIAVSPALDPAAPAPDRLEIRSVAPLLVTLATHDVRPRDAHGAPVARDLELFGQKVGREARVSFEVVLVRHD
jgi:polyisoprenoid-binding protein YceI